MEKQKVSSSNIDLIGYDPDKLILEIAFKNGSIYQYSRIPKTVFEKLMAAKSHGKFLDAHVKKGGYTYKKIK